LLKRFYHHYLISSGTGVGEGLGVGGAGVGVTTVGDGVDVVPFLFGIEYA